MSKRSDNLPNLNSIGYSSTSKYISKSTALTMQAKALYTAIKQYYFEIEDSKVFPARQTLAKEMNCHVSTIDRAIKELKEIGLLSVSQRGLTESNLYYFNDLSFSDIKEKLKPYLNAEDTLELELQIKNERKISDSSSAVTQESLHTVNKEYSTNKNKLNTISSKEEIASSSTKGDDLDLQKNLFSMPKDEDDIASKLKAISKLKGLTPKALAKAELVKSNEIALAEMSPAEVYAYFCKKQKDSLEVSPLDGKTPKDITMTAHVQGKILLDALRSVYKLSDDEILDTLDKLAEAYLKEDRDKFKYMTGKMISTMQDLVNKLLGNKVVKKAKERANWIKESDKEGTTRRRVNRDKFS